jgi:hypothetical protein
MSLKLGNKRQIHTETALVPEGEDLLIELTAYNWDIKLNFKFINDSEEKKGSWTIEDADDKAVIKLFNRNNSSGMVLPRLVEVGRTDEKPVYMIFYCDLFANVTKFDIQFYIDEVEENE